MKEVEKIIAKFSEAKNLRLEIDSVKLKDNNGCLLASFLEDTPSLVYIDNRYLDIVKMKLLRDWLTEMLKEVEQ